ncbi:MAG: DNA replication/repair protein RecF [Clostridia bacterium]|nr:DNA replication/repair protein RecF [Clostridia bacterium]
MKVLKLKASRYRNIENAEIEFSDGVNLLYGKNGAGKTNALEAVYLFAICKSFRTGKESDFIMHGSENAEISLSFTDSFCKNSENKNMGLEFLKNGKKKMLYEGVEIPKISEFVGRFRAVFFTPDHLSLIKGAPDERRRFADMALSQIKPSYIKCLNEYYRILSQRNSLLKKAKLGEKTDKDLLYVYSEALSQSAAVITKQRAYFSEYLEKEAERFYREISGGNENLFIRYISSEKDEPKDTEKTKNKYLSLYTSNIESEIRYGATKYGPHKDDLMFYIAKKRGDAEILKVCGNEDEENENSNLYAEFAARTFGSQGQQRSAVLSLKLAEGEIIRSLCGEYPVYLFDDVLSELDNQRKYQLMSLFSDKQVVITCCDENAFDKSLTQKRIFVDNGSYS